MARTNTNATVVEIEAPATVVEIEAPTTVSIRNFFYVNPAKPTSISTAFVTARTEGEVTTFSYTRSDGKVVELDRAGFLGFWSGTKTGGKGYFTETPESRKGYFDADGNLIRKYGERGAKAADQRAPEMPAF